MSPQIPKGQNGVIQCLLTYILQIQFETGDLLSLNSAQDIEKMFLMNYPTASLFARAQTLLRKGGVSECLVLKKGTASP